MYITHIIVGLGVGGAELMLKRLIEIHQDNPDYHIQVISLTTIGEVGEQIQALGIDVKSMGMQSIFDIPKVIWRLKQQLQASQTDIVQSWMYHSDLIGGLAARMAGKKNIIWGIRCTYISFKSSITTVVIRQLCALLSYWLPKKIICVAQAAKKLHVSLGYDLSKMQVIANGFEADKFNLQKIDLDEEQRGELYETLGISAEDFVIGNVGRFHIDKGQDIFVEAAAIVREEYPEIKFLLIGTGCDAENTLLAKLLEKFTIKDNFILLGERSDIPVCLGIMDVFCMPSRTEGFPNGLGEAMAAGLPCVASNVGDAAILVGDTAVLTKVEDPLALAKGLLEIIGLSTVQRLEMGEQAQARITHRFSIESTCQQFSGVYEQLLLLDKAEI